jgi:hypothetical protein
VLAADRLPLGECTKPARSDPPDGRDGRSLLRRYRTPPQAVTLDIDDTVDVVHGHQQLSLFNAHYNERCFLPIHVYDTATSHPVAVLLRPGSSRGSDPKTDDVAKPPRPHSVRASAHSYFPWALLGTARRCIRHRPFDHPPVRTRENKIGLL